MTEEAKHCINVLERNIQMGFPLVGDMVEAAYARTIINLIESLSAQLDQVTRERDEAWKIVESLSNQTEAMSEVIEKMKRKLNAEVEG